MSKRLRFILFLLLSITYSLHGQSDQDNLDKYWKFRFAFVEDFVKIGPNQGESLVMGARSPGTCIDNISEWGGGDYGTVHWGDGMIRHGHYLGFLATEYALKKRSKIDTRGVLNELYFALLAIDRIDAVAESSLQSIYNMDWYSDRELNGFYLREDVPEDFNLNWQDDPDRMMCVNSAYYENNNLAKIDDPENGLILKAHTSYQNVPSLDQMSSLMVGLSVVYKLVEDEFVQPDSRFTGFDIQGKVKEIVHRMIDFTASRNWFLIDVNGWPVGNGGGDVLIAASTLLEAAKDILGDEAVFNTQAIRRMQRTLYVQQCLTGFGLSQGIENQKEACKSIHFYDLMEKKAMIGLELGGIPGESNNQDTSVFMDWVQGGVLRVDVTKLDWIWKKTLADRFANMVDDLHDDGKMESLPWPLNKVMIGKDRITHYNNTIIFNLGVLSGWWDSLQVNHWGKITQNRQLELINAILRDELPYDDALTYRAYLDSMPIEGPYRLKGSNCCPATTELLKYQSGGWAAEYRWTRPKESQGEGGIEGIFSALDYMYFHNLYHLIFKDAEDYSVKMNYVTNHGQLQLPRNLSSADTLDAIQSLNSKLSKIKTSGEVISVAQLSKEGYLVGSKFNEYNKWGISTIRVLDENLVVPSGITCRVNSDLVVKEGVKILVEEGAVFKIDGARIQLEEGAQIDVQGTVRLHAGSEWRLLNGSEVIFKDRAQLFYDRNVQLNVERHAYLQISSEAKLIQRMDSYFSNLFTQIESIEL